MFLLRSSHPEPPGPTLTAAPAQLPQDRTQRRASHLRLCDRLAELGMQLTEVAHREALKEAQPPTTRKYSFPGLPERPGLPDTTPYRSTTFSELFIELSRCVRQAILLAARLDSGTYDHPGPNLAPSAPLHDQVPAAASPRPSHPSDHTRLDYEKLQDDLATDRNRSVPEILTGICEGLGRAADTGLATDLPCTFFPARPPQSPPHPPPGPPRDRTTKSPPRNRVAGATWPLGKPAPD